MFSESDPPSTSEFRESIHDVLERAQRSISCTHLKYDHIKEYMMVNSMLEKQAKSSCREHGGSDCMIYMCLSCSFRVCKGRRGCDKALTTHAEGTEHMMFVDSDDLKKIQCLICKSSFELDETPIDEDDVVNGQNSSNFHVRGMPNTGNKCYMNATLQMLLASPCLRGHYLEVAFEENTFSSHLKRLYTVARADGPSGALSNELDPIWSYLSEQRFRSLAQQDAYEALDYIINRLRDGELEVAFIDGSFGMEVRRFVKCSTCPNESNMVEFNNVLLVQLPKEAIKKTRQTKNSHAPFEVDGVPSLADLLSSQVFGKNTGASWRCNECKMIVATNKNVLSDVSCEKAPKILVIVILRFEGPTQQKVGGHVPFEEGLDFTPYMSRSEEVVQYRLVAVIEHVGPQARIGHYIAYVRDGEMWICANDTSILPTNLIDVLKKDAYVLMYEKI